MLIAAKVLGKKEVVNMPFINEYHGYNDTNYSIMNIQLQYLNNMARFIRSLKEDSLRESYNFFDDFLSASVGFIRDYVLYNISIFEDVDIKDLFFGFYTKFSPKYTREKIVSKNWEEEIYHEVLQRRIDCYKSLLSHDGNISDEIEKDVDKLVESLDELIEIYYTRRDYFYMENSMKSIQKEMEKMFTGLSTYDEASDTFLILGYLKEERLLLREIRNKVNFTKNILYLDNFFYEDCCKKHVRNLPVLQAFDSFRYGLEQFELLSDIKKDLEKLLSNDFEDQIKELNIGKKEDEDIEERFYFDNWEKAIKYAQEITESILKAYYNNDAAFDETKRKMEDELDELFEECFVERYNEIINYLVYETVESDSEFYGCPMRKLEDRNYLVYLVDNPFYEEIIKSELHVCSSWYKRLLDAIQNKGIEVNKSFLDFMYRFFGVTLSEEKDNKDILNLAEASANENRDHLKEILDFSSSYLSDMVHESNNCYRFIKADKFTFGCEEELSEED